MRRKWNLQLFEDGGESGSGAAQGGQAGSGDGGQGNAGGKGTYSFGQAEEIANARAQRAEQAALKSYFQQQGMTEDEVRAALAEYKTNKEKQKPNVSVIEQERDTYKKELEQMKNTNLLRDKGVKPDDLDYVLFKVGKLVDDKTDFSKAAEKFLKENPRYSGQGTYRVTTSTQAGGPSSAANENDSINARIRAAARR